LGKIFENINKVLVNGIVVLLALILGFIYWVFPADTLVPLWALCLVMVAAFFICIVIYALLSTPQKICTEYKLPSVKNISIKDNVVIFITENFELFSIQSLVSVYIQDSDEVERLIGLAYVETINEKGFLQLRLVVNTHPNLLETLIKFQNNSKLLETIKIKPTVPKIFLREDISNG